MLGREDFDLRHRIEDLAGQRIDVLDALDLVAKHRDADRLLAIRGHDFQRVALRAEGAGPQFKFIAGVVNAHQMAQNHIAPDHLPRLEGQHPAVIRIRVAEAVDARHGGHDQHVAAAEDRGRGGEPQPVDVLVDVRFLLHKQIFLRDVGFRLVVVVVADEIFDGVIREELFELAVELGGQRLVVAHDQRGPVDGLHHLRDGKGLAGAGGPQQRLMPVALTQARHQPFDGGRLVAGRLKIRYKLKIRHRICDPCG
jgi:hypothetical protein